MQAWYISLRSMAWFHYWWKSISFPLPGISTRSSVLNTCKVNVITWSRQYFWQANGNTPPPKKKGGRGDSPYTLIRLAIQCLIYYQREWACSWLGVMGLNLALVLITQNPRLLTPGQSIYNGLLKIISKLYLVIAEPP